MCRRHGAQKVRRAATKDERNKLSGGDRVFSMWQSANDAAMKDVQIKLKRGDCALNLE